jgi:protein dithiol:quinone oxidoreductase
MIFRGSGDCTQVLWRFLGLSIAEWALVWFVIFLVAALIAAIVRDPRSRRPFARR